MPVAAAGSRLLLKKDNAEWKADGTLVSSFAMLDDSESGFEALPRPSDESVELRAIDFYDMFFTQEMKTWLLQCMRQLYAELHDEEVSEKSISEADLYRLMAALFTSALCQSRPLRWLGVKKCNAICSARLD